MKDWTAEPAFRIAAAIRAGEVSARAVAEQQLAAIAQRNDTLRAFTDITTARALARADALDAARAQGQALPSLAGVPVAVKNLFDIAGMVTRAGSKINRDHAPASRDATLITRLEAAGAVLLGALNMGEYAYDFTGRNAHDGHSRNPHDTARMTGGSSGGSGGAVAGGLAAITLGSDTNGSIRVPASLCGIFGLKPSYGGLSRAGTFPFIASLDHVGPLARSVMDLALAYDAMRGADPLDPVYTRGTAEPVTPSLEAGLKGLRITRAGGYFTRMGEAEAFAAVDLIARALGAEGSVEFPEAHRARAAAFTITMIEGSSLHRDRIRTRPQDFDPEVRDRLIAGAMLPADWYVKAQKFRRWFQTEALKLFTQTDLILAPATPTSAPLVDQQYFLLDGQTLPVRPNLGIFTQPISFIGLPVVTVPVWPAQGMPIGVQIIAAPGKEALALRAAHWLESQGIVHAKPAK
ncbi:MAG: AtzE family amidohydrolase [Roseomonas sp.]|nr:AtzE family amidohydrolase [Roseomonas sp.]